MLTVEGDRFSNTPEADHFLVRGKPLYVGGRRDALALRWSAISKTAETIRTGSPQTLTDFSSMSEVELESYYRAIHPDTVSAARILVERYDFTPHHSLWMPVEAWAAWHSRSRRPILTFVRRRAGLEGYRLHDARHGHATLMLRQGVHPKIVQERLGHAKVGTTLDMYSHVTPGLQEAAALRFEEGLTKSWTPAPDSNLASR